MRSTRGGGPGDDLVIAAQRGDRKALDSLLAHYLPLLYNIVGRALNGHADVDDVVQETMLRAVRSIADLRDPSAFRSWLVAVAVRQVRDHVAARRVQAARDPGTDVPDPRADFVDLTILRLGLSGQRRETAEATRWLDHEDRELLALWWQEAAGTLDRDEVASGLGMTPAHTAVRIGRMKERLTTARLVVRALRARPPCRALAVVTTDWDFAPSPLWRKRFARHARECAHCQSHLTDMVPAELLLNGLPLLPAPLLAAVADQAAAHPAPAHQTPPPHRTPPPHQIPPPHHSSPARRGRGHRAPRPRQHASGVSHARALPKAAAYLQPKLIVAVIAATGCVAGGAVAVAQVHKAPTKAVAAARTLTVQPSMPRTVPPTVPAARPTRRITPKPVRRPSPRPTATPPPVRVTSTLKGAGAWAFTGAAEALTESGASWYYTWSTSHSGIVTPPGVAFVPMIWGPGSVTSAALDQAKSAGSALLGFNEPDMSSQSNMTVAQALNLWPRLMATGMQLGSPAVADNAATPGSWLDQFMSGAKTRGYRVNFITVHWYGGNFATSAAVSELRSYLQAIYARYHLPIWVTEFALANFGGSPQFPTDSQQAAFLTAATSMLASLHYVQRYAWFALPVSADDGNMGLFSGGPVATEVGRAFEAAGR